ncbi:SOS response-associated peptidase [Rhizobium sp. YS-1r]|uniref:SOS response-associated peptidase n=1 Tax=Rhizobium sp. YS-1r TaxID=1532558 RepID=UPI00050EB1EC|nr:SOS response-associated peptidase [Rhizobium sp. YS-1r]KGE01014.1 hypothetical protein JL39_07695 [Rhizobium sp. YS-1r]
MCGRIFIETNLKEMMAGFGFAKPLDVGGLDNQFPRYDGRPSEYYPIIIRDVVRESGQMAPVFVVGRWGFIAGWDREAKKPMINARSEGIATNNSFKSAYERRRCLVPIDGFFEWKDIHGTGKNKQPYAIAMKDRSKFALAGIYSSRRTDSAHEERSFAILTCAANEMMETIHDRMPVILHPADYERWLSEEPDPADLLKPFPSELMIMWPINPIRSKGPEVLDPLKQEEDEEPLV